MNIDEVKAAKKELEMNMLELLVNFEADTGVRVTRIDLEFITQISGRQFVASADVNISL